MVATLYLNRGHFVPNIKCVDGTGSLGFHACTFVFGVRKCENACSEQCYFTYMQFYLSHVMRKLVYATCEQQRNRSACKSAQSDQRLCYSLPR